MKDLVFDKRTQHTWVLPLRGGREASILDGLPHIPVDGWSSSRCSQETRVPGDQGDETVRPVWTRW